MPTKADGSVDLRNACDEDPKRPPADFCKKFMLVASSLFTGTFLGRTLCSPDYLQLSRDRRTRNSGSSAKREVITMPAIHYLNPWPMPKCRKSLPFAAGPHLLWLAGGTFLPRHTGNLAGLWLKTCKPGTNINGGIIVSSKGHL